MRNLIMCLTFTSFVLTGCATIPPKAVTYEQKQRVYNFNFDTTWSKISELISKENLPIKAIDKNSGIINTDFVQTSLDQVDKGNFLGLGILVKARYTLSFFVTQIDETHTKVIINSHIEHFGSQNEWVSTFNVDDSFLPNKYFKKLNELFSDASAGL